MEERGAVMSLFIRELRANRKSLTIWCVCMIFGVISGMAKYTAYSSGGTSSQALKDLPQSMKALLGMDSVDVTTISGFFALLFLYLAVAAAIHSALLGSGIFAKEERDGTIEFLAVKPMSRTAIVTSKLLAALVNLVALNLVTFVSSVFMVAAYHTGKDISGEIAVFFSSMFLIQLIFLSLGALVAARLKKSKNAAAVAADAVLLAYVVMEITNLKPELKALNMLSPFQYFSAGRIIGGRGLDPAVVAAALLLAAVFSALTYFFYRARDLNG